MSLPHGGARGAVRVKESRASPESNAAAPTTPAERIDLIDALRGFALFGVLLANIQFLGNSIFTMLGDARPAVGTADYWAARSLSWLVEGKFYLLFSLLFGLGMWLQAERAAARGADFVRLYRRRLLVLMGFALAHGLLIWYGDILLTYGLLGFVLLLMRGASNRALLVAASVLVALPAVLLGGCLGLISLATVELESAANQPEPAAATAPAEAASSRPAAETMPDKAEPDVAGEEDEDDVEDPDEFFRRLEAETSAAYRGGELGAILRARLREWFVGWVLLIIGGPLIAAMFFVGIVVGRARILAEPQRWRGLFRGLLWIALPLGLLANLAATQVQYAAAAEGDADSSAAGIAWAAATVLYFIGAPAQAFGYAAAIVALWHTAAGAALLRPAAAVGRMALSNYLGQSLICTTIFYGYGGGLYGQVGPAAGVGLAAAIFAFQLIVSTLWLRFFRFGPAEWLWRSLTYGRMQPMRAAARASAAE